MNQTPKQDHSDETTQICSSIRDNTWDEAVKEFYKNNPTKSTENEDRN